MVAVDSLTTVDLHKNPEAQHQQAVQQAQHDQKKDQTPAVDPLLLAYLEIFHSVQVNHETASINAKELQSNAAAQNHLINEEALFNFSTVSQTQVDAVKKSQRSTFLTSLNTRNQEISAIRNDLGDKLTVLKQNAQVSETNVNSTMNEDQQSISQGSSLMNMLVSLSNQVAQI